MLSKIRQLFARNKSPQGNDLAVKDRLDAIDEILEAHAKQLNRIERKVYRELQDGEAAESENPPRKNPLEELEPGDPIPPELMKYF